MIILSDLPKYHSLRNAPLADIGAEYRWKNSKNWKRVAPTDRIATCTYNELSPAWTELHEWRAIDRRNRTNEIKANTGAADRATD